MTLKTRMDTVIRMSSILLVLRITTFGNTIQTNVKSLDDTTRRNVTYVFYNHRRPTVTDHNYSYPDEQRLMNYILRGYEKSVRPVLNASTPVKIKMGLTLTQIFDMDSSETLKAKSCEAKISICIGNYDNYIGTKKDEKNQVLVTNVWLDQEWVDEFLTWDPIHFANITNLRIPCDKLWLPDLVLYNNAAEYTDGLMSANAMVKPNGEVFWPVPAKLQSSCKVDVTYFPFDEQKCKLKFGSWTYDGFQVDILNRTSEVDLANYVVNGEWELLSITIQRNVVYYQCCPEPFPDVTFYVHIRRRTLYYMYNVVFPCIMMSALTLLVFCLPPDSGEKIALGITVLLAFSVFMLAVAENLPETSEFVPLISVYLTIVMSLTSISVIMTVLVLNLHHRGPDRQEVPLWMRRTILGKIRQFLCMHDSSTPYRCSNETKILRSMSLKMTLDNIAQELQNEMQLENGLADTVVTDSQGTSLNSTRDVRYNSLQTENIRRARVKSNRHSYSHLNDEILQSLRRVIERHEQEDNNFEMTQDWRRVAQVVDRILFWVFFIGTSISTVIVLVICPAFR